MRDGSSFFVHDILLGSIEWLAPQQGETRCFIDLLTGRAEVRNKVASQAGLLQIMEKWKQDEQQWKQRRAPYLLYGR